MKNLNYKAKITIDDDGKIHAISYCNRLMPFQVLSEINHAVQEAVKRLNGELDWKKTYVHFEHNGVKYKQVDTDFFCEGCVFLKDANGTSCQHPHYMDGGKGICDKKIYVIDQ